MMDGARRRIVIGAAAVCGCATAACTPAPGPAARLTTATANPTVVASQSNPPAAPESGWRPVEPAVLLSDAGPPRITPGWPAGLWAVTPEGRVEQILTRRWRPLATSSTGAIAAVPRAGHGAIRIVEANGTVVRVPRSSGTDHCATWSANGDMLAFVAGSYLTYWRAHRPYQALAIAGRLGLTSSRGKVLHLERGLFPECPAWSPKDATLAYVSRSGNSPWRLSLYQHGRSSRIAMLPGPAPSLDGPATNRSFAWRPHSDELLFVRGDSLVLCRTGTIGTLSTLGSFRRIDRMIIRSGWLHASRYSRGLTFSPDGQLVAGYVTGVIGIWDMRTGHSNRLIPGIFHSWAGNDGVLAVSLTHPCKGCGDVTLIRYGAVTHTRTLVARYYKNMTIADPDGRWAAYSGWERRNERALYFLNGSGKSSSRVWLRFRPRIIGAIGRDGRMVAPAWP